MSGPLVAVPAFVVARVFKRGLRLFEDYTFGVVDRHHVIRVLYGWSAYASQGNTYTLRKMIWQRMEEKLSGEISTKEFYRYRREFEKA